METCQVSIKEKNMNTQNENQESTSIRNPFPEPQTIPTGWDTSVFASAPQSVSIEEAEDSAES
jgi:hypothetical protein